VLKQLKIGVNDLRYADLTVQIGRVKSLPHPADHPAVTPEKIICRKRLA
jgi:hypothetical protein